jgi:transketolase N-terminal domain/subunit
MSTKNRKLNDIKKLEDSSFQIRKKILINSHKKKISHLASSLSCVDIVNF